MVLAAALSAGLGFVSPASAESGDLNSKRVTKLGGFASYASGVNDAGQVVGDSYTATIGVDHAFITGPNGVGMTDLNSLMSLPAGVVLNNATAINNHGQLVVTSVIPEPGIYALLLAGLGLLGFMGRHLAPPELSKRRSSFFCPD